MALLGRDDILQAADLTFEDVEVPEWGGTVRVRMLTGAERDQMEAQTVERKGNKIVSIKFENIRARLVALTVVDEKGERLFTEKDVEALGRKSAAALNRVFETARILNGLMEEALDEAKENFTNGQSGDSASG